MSELHESFTTRVTLKDEFQEKKQWTLASVKFPAQINKSTKHFPKVSLETFFFPNFAALVCGSLPFISKAQIWHRQNTFIRYYIH